jgi:integration host factor subunit alpha
MTRQSISENHQSELLSCPMTKARLIERTQELGYNRKTASELVEDVIGMVKDIMASGEDLKISGFGKFEVRQKKDRRGRNPQTGEAITIEARKVVTFKPSHLLKQAINKEN